MTGATKSKRSHEDIKPVHWRYDIFDSGSSCTLSEEEDREDAVFRLKLAENSVGEDVVAFERDTSKNVYRPHSAPKNSAAVGRVSKALAKANYAHDTAIEFAALHSSSSAAAFCPLNFMKRTDHWKKLLKKGKKSLCPHNIFHAVSSKIRW